MSNVDMANKMGRTIHSIEYLARKLDLFKSPDLLVTIHHKGAVITNYKRKINKRKHGK